MPNYIEQEVKQSKILEYSDLLSQVARVLEKKEMQIDLSEYEEQLISNNYADWARVVAMLRDAEIEEDLYEDFLSFPSHYKIVGNEIIYNENWEAEEAQKEAERKAMLNLTRGDVFAALIQSRLIDENTLKAQLEQLPEETMEQKVTKMLSLNALTNALNFHRGHALVNVIGAQLGITSENLDMFFETNDYRYLTAEYNS